MVANYLAAYEATIEAHAATREAPLARTTARSSGSRYRRSARSRPSRSTSSSTPRSSGTSAAAARRARARGDRPVGVFAIFNFLQYGTTAQVARAAGAGEDETARRLGAQALWLSLGFGIAVSARVAALAAPLVALWARGAGRRLRRHVPPHRGDRLPVGVSRARRAGVPARRLRPADAARDRHRRQRRERRARGALRLRLRLGDRGLGLGDGDRAVGHGRRLRRVDCSGASAGRARLRLDLARRLLSLGKFIFIRTAALIARSSSPARSSTRFGDAPLAAHQIAFQLWIFLALVLDAIAIAGQIIVGRELGAGRARRAFARACA